MGAVGHTVKPTALAEALVEEEKEKEQIEALIAGEQEEPAEVPADRDAAERMQELLSSLREELCGMLRREADADVDATATEELLAELQTLPAEQRERLADGIALNGHRPFIRRRYMGGEEFRQLVKDWEQEAPFALFKLVPRLQQELEERGFSLETSRIRKFFQPDAELERVPQCLACILRRLDGEYRCQLVPLEELVGDGDPDEWLEETRKKLLFRSHSAMHKAIAEVSSLKYDCVHKALSGRSKAKRIQVEIKYCLEKWLKQSERDEEPEIDDEYRGVPVGWTCELLPALERRFETKEALYRRISEKTGIKAGSVRRYFQSNGQLKYAPLSVYRYARNLADGVPTESRRESYLADSRTSRVASRLAAKANAALRRWRASSDAPELELEFRQARHELIAAIKEGWHTVPADG